MTNSLKILLLLAVVLGMHYPTLAQKKKDKKKEEEKVPVYNYVIDDPMDVFGRQPVPPDSTFVILMPDFFQLGFFESQRGDTVIKHVAYNAKNEVILEDTLSNYQLLRYLSYID